MFGEVRGPQKFFLGLKTTGIFRLAQIEYSVTFILNSPRFNKGFKGQRDRKLSKFSK